MSKQSELGKKGEELAAEHLRKKGFAILKQNFFWEKAEVDIVASIGKSVVFVEVKTRESPYLSDPALMVPMRKQRQIIKAADAYMKVTNCELEPRFDIIVIVTNSQYTTVDHIEEAFYPTL